MINRFFENLSLELQNWKNYCEKYCTDAIWKLLSLIYLSEPTQQQYENITKDFDQMWNMPNCVGSIDGKHIAIKCPPKSGFMYYNYKKFFSIVLLAACDAKYIFTAVFMKQDLEKICWKISCHYPLIPLFR